MNAVAQARSVQVQGSRRIEGLLIATTGCRGLGFPESDSRTYCWRAKGRWDFTKPGVRFRPNLLHNICHTNFRDLKRFYLDSMAVSVWDPFWES